MQTEILKSPNFSDTDLKMDGIVFHTTLGSYAGAVEHLTNKLSGVSSHFVIGRNEGEFVQLVDLDKMAWHAGRINNPSERAKGILKRNIFRKGGYENPNKHLIGMEFACGYDIDRDGILESWEKLYTANQIKYAVWLILNIIEPELGIKIISKNALIHKDIYSYKPDLEIQRAMVLAELDRQRGNDVGEAKPHVEAPKAPKLRERSELILNHGERLKVEINGEKIHMRKM